MYEHENKIRKYYPDFEVTLSSGRVFHIEVKPKNKFKNHELVARFKSIQQRYQNHHAEFLILTDEVIRQEPLLSNLKSIARFKSLDGDISQTLKNVESLLKTETSYTFNDIVSMFGYQNALMLLARQNICCDHYQDLVSPNNFIRLPQEADHDTVFF